MASCNTLPFYSVLRWLKLTSKFWRKSSTFLWQNFLRPQCCPIKLRSTHALISSNGNSTYISIMWVSSFRLSRRVLFHLRTLLLLITLCKITPLQVCSLFQIGSFFNVLSVPSTLLTTSTSKLNLIVWLLRSSKTTSAVMGATMTSRNMEEIWAATLKSSWRSRSLLKWSTLLISMRKVWSAKTASLNLRNSSHLTVATNIFKSDFTNKRNSEIFKNISPLMSLRAI